MSGLTGLQTLYLSSNQITDISFLSGLTGLQTLYLRSNQITDISFLSGLTGLQTLDLSSNQITDISFLSGLTGLQTLDLSSNQITDISFLSGLTGLQTLDLSSNQITDISFLSGLTGLQTLYLRSNKITDYSFLSGLTGLQTLDLRSNQITDYSFLSGLTGLQTLYLRSNQITDYSFLSGLTGLHTLDLSSNQITDISFLSGLTGLQTLDLRYNQITDISFLSGLTGLQTLDLRSNKITDISFLSGLTGLQTLYLSSNQITDYSFLSGLTGLQTLYLSSNQITDYSFLSGLTGLQTLYLSSNQITDISFLSGLTGLQTLDLRSNQITDYSFLSGLTGLQTLYLSSNQITDISFLSGLTGLQTLYLSSNQITDISFLSGLTGLQTLDLRYNQITDISFLSGLTGLYTLDLSSNKITDIPSSIFELFHNYNLKDDIRINGLNLYNNPLSTPPVEIIKQGREAVLEYFQDIETGEIDYLYEAKILIVGDGGVGKTTLARKMEALDAEMPEKGSDRTKGIEIQAMPIKNIHKPDVTFLMNVWDFGGQGYYHSTHQFFLTKRSLYVLVNNTRTNKTDFNHWIQTISLFSDNSPIIIIENEEGNSKSELDLRGLQQYFDNILYVREADLSNISDGRLEKLINDINIDIQRLPHIGSELPKQWVKVREALKVEAEVEPYISDRRFYKICKANRISDKDTIRRLGDLFHDLGVFLHFRKDEILSRIVILQNTWATKGVYQILDSEQVRSKNGYFTTEEAERIWESTEFEDMHYELVRMMEKFELCYRIPYSSPVAYISPNLLPAEKPDYNWNTNQNLIIYYHYDFMPKGLLGRLIVRLHRYVKDIKNRAWKNGCVFHYQDTDAQIIETYGSKKLEIRIKGKHCVNLSSIIIHEIDKLNEGFERIKVKKMLPCNCDYCLKGDDRHFYDYENLMRRKAKRKRYVECDKSYDEVEVLQILDAVYDKSLTESTITVGELIRQNKIKDAIDLIEEDHPDEATLLLARYNQVQRHYEILGIIRREDWEIEIRKITNSLVRLSKMSDNTEKIRSQKSTSIVQIDEKLDNIESKLKGQDLLLNKLIKRSKLHQYELISLLEDTNKILTEEFAHDIVTIIERGMQDFTQKVPQAKDIIADWQKASKELNLSADYKTKLKWSIPFLFFTIEKEFAWNGKHWFSAIREDIKRGVKGNWEEMFVLENGE